MDNFNLLENEYDDAPVVFNRRLDDAPVVVVKSAAVGHITAAADSSQLLAVVANHNTHIIIGCLSREQISL